MERIAETGKQHEPSAAAIGHSRSAAPSAASLPPALQLQQMVGNQAMQEFLRSGYIQAKLAISNPDDPEEREADQVAHTIMRKAAGAPFSSPCSCSHDGEMCEDCQQRQSQPTISRRASAPAAPAHVPRIVSDVLRSPGHPLDSATRSFFEPRFGHDFSHVRVHTDSPAAESARSIQAHAYTAGPDIVFAHGQYSPTISSGRHLLAHELTHVLQQGPPAQTALGSSARTGSPIIQRSPAPPGRLILPPTMFSDESKKERSHWRAAVDLAVRKQFKLTGPRIADSQVSYVSPKDFGSLFKGKDLESALLTTFLDTDNVDAQNILRSDTRVAYMASGRYWPTPDGWIALKEFVQEGITKNSFAEGGGGGLDIKTGKQMFPPSTITPGALLANEFAGVTTSAGPRSARHISLRNETPASGRGVFVQVFVHEACHFYGHDAYDLMIRGLKAPDDAIGNARIGQILAEGVPEFFAREVTIANGEDFGDVLLSYPAEFEQAAKLIALLGEDTVIQAYFRGKPKEIQRIVAVVENARHDRFPDPIEPEKLFEPSHK